MRLPQRRSYTALSCFLHLEKRGQHPHLDHFLARTGELNVYLAEFAAQNCEIGKQGNEADG
jgi:hypothetical protein